MRQLGSETIRNPPLDIQTRVDLVRRIYDAIRSQGTSTRQELAERLGLPLDVTGRLLQRLSNRGVIEYDDRMRIWSLPVRKKEAMACK